MNIKMVALIIIALTFELSSNLFSQVSEVLTRTDGDHTVFFDADFKELPSSEGAAYYRNISYKNGRPVGITSVQNKNSGKR